MGVKISVSTSTMQPPAPKLSEIHFNKKCFVDQHSRGSLRILLGSIDPYKYEHPAAASNLVVYKFTP